MTYLRYFQQTDATILHLTGVVATCPPQLASQYAGFAAVSAVTVYELAIKEVFIEFGRKKHSTFGYFVERHFKKLNGHISLGDLRRETLPRFGDRYLTRFEKYLTEKENQVLRASRASVRSSYGNLITWRNAFAHEGVVPVNATFAEVARSYQHGKLVIECLERALVR